MFSVSAPTIGGNVVSAPPSVVQRNPPPSTSKPRSGAGAHIPESIKSPPPPSISAPLSRSFLLADPPLFSSPLFYSWPVNCFWYLPTLGGGEADSYFKKAVPIAGSPIKLSFLLTHNRKQLSPKCETPSALKREVLT